MRKNKWLAFGLAAVMAVCAAGCSTPNTSVESAAAPQAGGG